LSKGRGGGPLSLRERWGGRRIWGGAIDRKRKIAWREERGGPIPNWATGAGGKGKEMVVH